MIDQSYKHRLKDEADREIEKYKGAILERFRFNAALNAAKNNCDKQSKKHINLDEEINKLYEDEWNNAKKMYDNLCKERTSPISLNTEIKIELFKKGIYEEVLERYVSICKSRIYELVNNYYGE